jgi:hypothetical protein
MTKWMIDASFILVASAYRMQNIWKWFSISDLIWEGVLQQGAWNYFSVIVDTQVSTHDAIWGEQRQASCAAMLSSEFLSWRYLSWELFSAWVTQ